jgi:hypothetical protein
MVQFIVSDTSLVHSRHLETFFATFEYIKRLKLA